MRATETIAQLARFERRGPGSDSERRAASWLAGELQAGGREVRVETFWCRPNWGLAHAWHVALAIAGSLLSVATPRVGGILVVAALVSVIADWLTGASPGRRLTPERASQNVVATAPAQAERESDRVHLTVVANYDAGRMGLAYRDVLRAGAARLRRAAGVFALGWMGGVSLLMAWLLVVAILRLEGHHGTTIGAVQLPPTAALLVALALLLDQAGADYAPAAGDNASGAAVALALVRALDAAPPRHVEVELVLEGAGEGGGIGLRRYLRARRRELRTSNVVVLGVAACGGGHPRWWLSDGQLVPLRYPDQLRRLCADISAEEPHLEATAHTGRGATPALPARIKRLPAIAIGCLDDPGLVLRSHQPADTAASIDSGSVDATLEFALMLMDALDSLIGESAQRRVSAATPG